MARPMYGYGTTRRQGVLRPDEFSRLLSSRRGRSGSGAISPYQLSREVGRKMSNVSQERESSYLQSLARNSAKNKEAETMLAEGLTRKRAAYEGAKARSFALRDERMGQAKAEFDRIMGEIEDKKRMAAGSMERAQGSRDWWRGVEESSPAIFGREGSGGFNYNKLYYDASKMALKVGASTAGEGTAAGAGGGAAAGAGGGAAAGAGGGAAAGAGGGAVFGMATIIARHAAEKGERERDKKLFKKRAQSGFYLHENRARILPEWEKRGVKKIGWGPNDEMVGFIPTIDEFGNPTGQGFAESPLGNIYKYREDKDNPENYIWETIGEADISGYEGNIYPEGFWGEDERIITKRGDHSFEGQWSQEAIDRYIEENYMPVKELQSIS